MNTKQARCAGMVIAALCALSPLLLFAAEFRSGEQVALRADETISDDVYLVGGSVTASGAVKGDLYATGGTVLVNGPVAGDVVAGGGTVTLTGSIGDDLRVAGGTIVVQGDVKDDAVIGGGDITLNGSVGGDVALGGGDVRLAGSVGGNVRISGGDVYLNGPIAGSVSVDAGTLTIGSGAILRGNLTYRSPRQANVAPDAQMLGRVSYEPMRVSGGQARVFGLITVAALVRFLMLLSGALVLGLTFTRSSREVIRLSVESALKEMGRGLLCFVALPVVSVLLFVTIIGIPLGLLGLIGFAAFLVFAYLFAPVLLGGLLYRFVGKETGYRADLKSILLGAVVFSLLGLIPVVGWLMQALLILIALGSALRLKWEVAKEWR